VRWDELRVGDVVLGYGGQGVFLMVARTERETHWLSLDDAHEVRMAPSTAEIKMWRLFKGPAWGGKVE
jgi:hypothetical protein